MNIEKLRDCYRHKKVLWSTHGSSRIQQRGILRIDVINCIMNGEIKRIILQIIPIPAV